MYGLLLESLVEHIKTVYGEEKWEEVRKKAGVEQTTFSTHNVYPENLVQKMSKTASEVLGISEREFMCNQGNFFVEFVGQYGYDRVLSVLGRHMRDFLNGLDNLHEYLKFSYPRMKAPSFFVENESSSGLTLQYRSKRRGFNYYTMGQIRQVGKLFYNTDVLIELVKEECVLDLNIVTFQLTFDNRAFSESATLARDESHLTLKSSVFMDIFPFCIIFGSDMVIKSIGNSLAHILPQVVGQKVADVFNLSRPLIEFKFHAILKRTNNIFELETNSESITPLVSRASSHPADDDVASKLTLKGQMLYMEEWRMIIFLGTPIMADLDAMINSGLYINDLSMHDFSRDLMMAGTQQSVELKLALDQEKQKAQKLEQSMKKLDEEMKRTDELLYQMIPKTCADRLRKGENPVDTCQVFECVTILFSDVVTFTEICSRISPMEVVSMLNAMYSLFDRLTELNGVYKVETIGDAYMVVGGAPVNDELHASRICDMALDMLDAIQDLTDPSTGNHLRIRVGIHSGTVVAGIVGLKMPRYCLFGDSVNTASRMESTSEAMRVHVSQTTRELLSSNYLISERGEIIVKGKGNMKTYWLNGKSDREPSARSGRLSVVKANSDTSSAIRGYSPVTLDDIKKTSVTSSPAHSCKSALSLSPGSAFPLFNNRQSVNLNVRNDSLDRSVPLSPCPVQCSPPLAHSDGTSHMSTSGQGIYNDRSQSKNDQLSTASKVDMQLIMTCPHGVAMELSPSTLRGIPRKVGLNSRPTSTSTPWKSPGCPLSRGLKVGALPDITVAHHNDISPLHHRHSPLDGSTGQLLEAKSADSGPAGDMTSVCCPGFGGRRSISTKNPASPICLLL